MSYKIYKRGGYFYIIDTADNREREGLATSVKVSRGTTIQDNFYFKGINNWSENKEVNISEIQDNLSSLSKFKVIAEGSEVIE